MPIISIVSEGELRSLALQLAWGTQKQQELQDMLGYLTIVPLPFEGVIDAYAAIEDFSRRHGITMGKNDLLIAATAHVTGARLLTTDRDFDDLHTVFLERDWVDRKAVL